ncbi:hypothetical protein BASA62_001237 [Batrachochytrium salamandrivorans]|nr:hypothetical protein BASA62_001237 [Batrachochytrium salamandrivorans]
MYQIQPSELAYQAPTLYTKKKTSLPRRPEKCLPSLLKQVSAITIQAAPDDPQCWSGLGRVSSSLNSAISTGPFIHECRNRIVSTSTHISISELPHLEDSHQYPLPSDSNATPFKVCLAMCLQLNATNQYNHTVGSNRFETTDMAGSSFSSVNTRVCDMNLQQQPHSHTSDLLTMQKPDMDKTPTNQKAPTLQSQLRLNSPRTPDLSIQHIVPSTALDSIATDANVPNKMRYSREAKHEDLTFSGTIISVTAYLGSSPFTRWFQTPTREIRCGMWTRKIPIHLEIRSSLISEHVLLPNGQYGDLIYSMPTCSAAYALLPTKHGKFRFLLKNTADSDDPPRVFEVVSRTELNLWFIQLRSARNETNSNTQAEMHPIGQNPNTSIKSQTTDKAFTAHDHDCSEVFHDRSNEICEPSTEISHIQSICPHNGKTVASTNYESSPKHQSDNIIPELSSGVDETRQITYANIQNRHDLPSPSSDSLIKVQPINTVSKKILIDAESHTSTSAYSQERTSLNLETPTDTPFVNTTTTRNPPTNSCSNQPVFQIERCDTYSIADIRAAFLPNLRNTQLQVRSIWYEADAAARDSLQGLQHLDLLQSRAYGLQIELQRLAVSVSGC